MIRPSLVTALFYSALASFCQAAEVVDGRTFRIPDGFVLEKVAGPPLVDRPIVADFDERGRLYVADSSGSNDNVKKQEVERTHRIVRLEDLDGDGKFDRSVVFADKMMFPEGAMWFEGSLYVAAPPSIWKLTDTDNDGIADRREEWFQGKTLTGCANDLHGPYAGPDGRIYWCKGAFASQTYERPGKKPLVTRAAHIFRARPDGTEVEPVMTGGMDNPVEVAFTPEGERIFTTTFLQHPGGGKRDGLIHALYGGVYGKVHDVIDGHPRTSPEVLSPLIQLGPAAPSGLMRAESDALGCRDNLFTACFNLRKIARHKLRPEGASFSDVTDDFIASDDHDFHPTDVLEDADGSILVVDTGGWYKLCCPTSQLVKPDVLGAIYRVRRKDAPKIEDPRGLKLAWPSLTPDDLAGLIGDARPAVRRRAVARLARLGNVALLSLTKVLQDSPSVEARRNAVWTACRVDSPEARSVVRKGLDDREPSVRQVASHASSLWRDRLANDRLIEILKTDSPAVSRAAAEALGRIDRAEAIPSLLQAASNLDPALRHSSIFAMIEIDDPSATRAGLESPSPLVRRAALMALDQMEGGQLRAEPVITSLPSTSTDLKEAAWWIAGRHPEWGTALADYLGSRLDSDSPANPINATELEGRLASMARSDSVQALIGSRLSDRATRPAETLILLKAMARSGLKELPPGWIDGLTKALATTDLSVIRQAVATSRALAIRPASSKDLPSILRKVAGRPSLPIDVRLGALAAVSQGLTQVEPVEFSLLVDRLRPDRQVADRMLAAEVLARAVLSPSQRVDLTESLASATPLEFPRLLEAFDKAEGVEIGLKLIDALKRSPARSTLRVETLKTRLARFGPSVAEAAEALYKAIEADSLDRRENLEKHLANLSGGDVRRGQAVFNSPKAACVTCHAIGYVGGKLGPDLTKIGQVRAERDLLESIIYPSASFVRSYEPVSVATKDGKVVSGLLRKDAPDEVVVAVAADRDERVARDQVEEIAPGTVSIMPAGLDRQITPGELADLIAFLKACR
jgi:putative membrane-bound dehydrogenase-like protein